MRAAVVEAPRAQAVACALLVCLTSSGWSACTLALTTSERVTVAIPFGPAACSVTLTGAVAVALTRTAERWSDWATALVVTHARAEPIPIVGGRLAGRCVDARPASTIAIAAAATSVESSNANGGRRFRI